MSLCYDFQKWTMVSLASVAITLIVGLIILFNPFAHGQSDFYLEGKTKSSDMITAGDTTLKVTKFEIQGNSSSYKDMCPSLQCKIDYKDKYASFSPPDIPENTLMFSTVDFRLQDNITHADLGPKKKELVEQYNAHIICDVYDIVEKNGQEVYYCRHANILSEISNKFDDRSWDLNVTGIYDAKNETLKISGNFTGE